MLGFCGSGIAAPPLGTTNHRLSWLHAINERDLFITQ